MKKIAFFLLIALVGVFASCNNTYKKGDVMTGTTSAKIDTVSYCLGAYFGGMIKGTNFGEIDLNQLDKGFNDVINDKDEKIPSDQIMNIINNYIRERMAYSAEKAKADAELFFEENKSKEGVVTTESGLQYKIIAEGTGISPEANDTVEVHYRGTLLDGTEFDSSYERNEPTKFCLNQVIPGWSEGMLYAKEGGKIELYVPSKIGYGERDYGPIPANSALVFEVELLKVFKAPVEEVPEAEIVEGK